MLNRASKSCAFVAALALSLSAALTASAQEPPAADGEAANAANKDAAEERAQSFQAVEGAVKEDVPGGPLLVLGYGVLWVALLLYVVRLARQQQGLQRDLIRLERALGKEPGGK